MKTLSVSQAAQLIKEQKKILILTHRNPDGDTLGCAFALMRAARAFGIEAKVFCCDKIPEKYGYMFCPEDLSEANGGDAYIIAVDIADIKLTGSEYSDKFAGRVGLCIDHHISNTGFSENLVLRDCAAACEIILDIIKAMGAEIDKKSPTASIQAFQRTRAVSAFQTQPRIHIRRRLSLLRQAPTTA